MNQQPKRPFPLIVGTVATLLFFFIVVPAVYACSPPMNLVILCDDVYDEDWIYDREDLVDALTECPQLMQNLSAIEALVFRQDVFITIVATNYGGNQRKLSDELDAHQYYGVNCATKRVEESSELLIGYNEMPPYCVSELSFCESYTVSNIRKLGFDLRNGNYLSLLGIAVFLSAGIVSGIHLSNEAFSSGKYLRFKRYAQFTKRRVIGRILLILLGTPIAFLLLFIVPSIFIFYARPLLHWIFYPSSIEFHFRVGILSAIIAFVVTQIRQWRNAERQN